MSLCRLTPVFRRIPWFGTPEALQAVLVAKNLEVHTSVLVCTGNSNIMRSRMLLLVVRNGIAWTMVNEEAEVIYYFTAPLDRWRFNCRNLAGHSPAAILVVDAAGCLAIFNKYLPPFLSIYFHHLL